MPPLITFAISYLTKTIRNWKRLILNGDHMHMRCFAHILNLIVSDGLKEHDEYSPRRLQQFKACVDAVKITCKSNLSLDVPTRWNSTHLMLTSAEKYEKAFKKLEEDDGSFLHEMRREGGPPTTEDWSCIREYMKFLETFYTMTLHVSASLHITTNMYIGEVCNLKIAIQTHINGDNMTLRRMTIEMQKKFDKYWGSFDKINMLVYVAVVLDPSHKTRFLCHCLTILFDSERAAQYLNQVEDVVEKLYIEYKGDTNEDQTPISSNIRRKSPISTSSLMQSHSSAVYLMFYGSEKSFESNNETNMSDIAQYLSEKLESFSDNSDLLFWWKRNSVKYQILSEMTKDILVISISTVASESAFSCGGRVLDAFRSSLSPQNVEALICSQSWLKAFNLFKVPQIIDEDSEADTITTVEDDLAINENRVEDDMSSMT